MIVTFGWIKRPLVVELICFLVMVNFFYEGIYKFVHLEAYKLWVGNIPYLTMISKPLVYIIPLMELGLALLFVVRKFRSIILQVSLLLVILFILYLFVSLLFSTKLFFPFNAFWGHAVWFQKMIFLMVLAWLMFIAISLDRKSILYNKEIAQ